MGDEMNIIRLKLIDNQVEYDDAPQEMKLLGGRALTAKIICDEVNPARHPLGPSNKFVLAPGLPGGTGVPSSGRLSIGAKSPLTNEIKEANGGDTAGLSLAKLGIKALIIEEAAEEWVDVHINNEGVCCIPATEVIGLGTYETVNYYRKKYGKDVSIVCIGPAGERQYAIAGIALSAKEGWLSRSCAGGGLGAVMGSKHIKAIIIEESKDSLKSLVHQEVLKNICRDWAKELSETKKIPTKFGTIGSNAPENSTGCSAVMPDAEGNYLTSGFEYEAVGLLGANCGIKDLDIIARMERFCDDFGLDTMELGVTIGVAMEAGIIKYGDEIGFLSIRDEIINDTILGKVLCQGAEITCKVLGVKHIPAVERGRG